MLKSSIISMQEHLIMQFKDKPNLSALLSAIGGELDALLQVFDDLEQRRWIDTGEGVQLDGIGTIVDQGRIIPKAIPVPFFAFVDQPNALAFGIGRFRDSGEAWLSSAKLNDPEYRLMLWAKVAKNTSIGTTEDTIQSLKFVFKAPIVYIFEVGNAKFVVGIGRSLTAAEVVMAKALDLTVRAGGVGILWQTHFNYDSYFGFYGQRNAKGFDIGAFADVI